MCIQASMQKTHTNNQVFSHGACQVSLWVTFLLTSVVLKIGATSSHVWDFEDPNDFKIWTTLNKSKFYDVSGLKYPKVDATLGTEQGHFAYAKPESSNPEKLRMLFSPCLQPSGPRCRLNFSTIIQSQEELLIATMLMCDDCERNRPKFWMEEQLTSTPSFQGWTRKSILLGAHPVDFEISIIASVPQPNDFVAIDDLQLLDCEPEVKQITCPEFKCSDNQYCWSRDQMCDLHPDCLCEDDEREEICEVVPPEGGLRLHNCDFDSGFCLWYNVNGDKGKGKGNVKQFRWRIASESIPTPTQLQRNNSLMKVNYLYVTMPPPSPGDAAILRSVSFQPRFSGSGLCQARFWHRGTAKGSVLKLELIEIGRPYKPKRELWEHVNTGQKFQAGKGGQRDDGWKRVVVDLNTFPINVSYVLQFKVYSSDRRSDGEVAIHSVSLSPDCFYAALSLSSCGAVGAKGPNQQQCDMNYDHDGLVNVVESGPFKGVQSWTVPENMTYRIQALGSRGGTGIYAQELVRAARGARVTAKFRLEKGEELFFLIGQPGEDACQKIIGSNRHRQFDCQLLYNSTGQIGGGGGGGGATVVYKMNKDNEPEVLVIAAGGGGLPLSPPSHNIPGASLFLPEMSTLPYETSPYADASYLMNVEEAEQLLAGSLEGREVCGKAGNQNPLVGASGGFGGGGVACYGAGGNGGGSDISREPVSLTTWDVGVPGRSYVHSSAIYELVEPGTHMKSGFVEINPVKECPCDYHCLWLDNKLDKPTCLCPDHLVLGPDGLSCVVETKDESNSYLFLLVIVGALFVIFVSVLCLCLYIQRRTLSVKKVASFMCPCFHFSRRPLGLSAHVLPQIQRPPTVMHVNPNYDIVSRTKFPEQGLKELPRKHLKLMSELGQGAFGEVYYGLLSNVPMVDGDLPVAVKTLPPVCTEQTELDFLMEAVIVSKFNHPNIVKFIGVCFEQHPHYLVLELLEGGDLKSFLRHGRPKWDQPSSLTVLDLLRLSLDVARGCQHLEEKHFIHRDIAARNCLLTTKGPNRTAKIADFGMARDIYRSDYYKKAGKAMLPVKWMPPEAFLDGVFTSKTDVWSFGIVLWEVFSLGHMPYPGCSNEEVMNLVTQGDRLDPPEGCPSAVFDIMVSCWSALPEARPNFGLIIASLERTLQDDDTASRGVPVFYVPPIINTRGGLRLHERQSPRTQHREKGATARAATNVSNVSRTLSPNTSGDDYLEPLLTQSARGNSNDAQATSTPDNCGESGTELKYANHNHSSRDTANGSIFMDNGRPGNKNSARTPRVFSKPGSNHFHSSNDGASESLLRTRTSSDRQGRNNAQNGSDMKGMNTKAKGSGGEDDEDEDEGNAHADDENLKMGAAVALPAKSKKKSYTHFPRPAT